MGDLHAYRFTGVPSMSTKRPSASGLTGETTYLRPDFKAASSAGLLVRSRAKTTVTTRPRVYPVAVGPLAGIAHPGTRKWTYWRLLRGQFHRRQGVPRSWHGRIAIAASLLPRASTVLSGMTCYVRAGSGNRRPHIDQWRIIWIVRCFPRPT